MLVWSLDTKSAVVAAAVFAVFSASAIIPPGRCAVSSLAGPAVAAKVDSKRRRRPWCHGGGHPCGCRCYIRSMQTYGIWDPIPAPAPAVTGVRLVHVPGVSGRGEQRMMVAAVMVVNAAVRWVIDVPALRCRCRGAGRRKHGVCRRDSPAMTTATAEAGTTAVSQDLLFEAEAEAMPCETELHFVLRHETNETIKDVQWPQRLLSPHHVHTTAQHQQKHYRSLLGGSIEPECMTGFAMVGCASNH